jgi:AcrR family transcriptional regulator
MSEKMGLESNGCAAAELSQSSAKKSSRGEQTRRQILSGALEVLAEQGYKALTHRAIAKAAGVSLSLTTYHFKDLGALVNQAFRFYKYQVLENFTDNWDQLYRDQLQALLATAPEMRRATLVDVLSRHLADAIIEDVKLHPEGVAVEMTFNFDLHISSEQRVLAFELCHRLYPHILRVYQTFESAKPEIDTMLLLETVHILRFRKLSVPSEISDEMIYERLNRLIHLQFSDSQA